MNEPMRRRAILLVRKMNRVRESLSSEGCLGELGIYADAVYDTALYLLGKAKFVDKYTCLDCLSNSFLQDVYSEKCLICGSEDIRWEFVKDKEYSSIEKDFLNQVKGTK